MHDQDQTTTLTTVQAARARLEKLLQGTDFAEGGAD